MKMLKITSLFLLVSTSWIVAAENASSPDAPWLKARSMTDFQFLLDRSPFSLPTAEESAPMADRFFLTGAATLNEEPVVFVIDKNTQTRHMLSKTPILGDNALLEFLPDVDPKKMKATIRIEGQVTTVQYAETTSEGQPPQPQMRVGQPGVPTPATPAVQPQNGNVKGQAPARVIRRRVISGQNPSAQPNPGQ